MGRRIVDLHPEAVADGREAREWYQARSAQAAELFRRDLEDAIDRIREAPETWPRYLHGTRRYVLRVFP
jgi:plasmid stabilization system protein ParE